MSNKHNMIHLKKLPRHEPFQNFHKQDRLLEKAAAIIKTQTGLEFSESYALCSTETIF